VVDLRTLRCVERAGLPGPWSFSVHARIIGCRERNFRYESNILYLRVATLVCVQPSGNSFSTTVLCRVSALAPLIVHRKNDMQKIRVRGGWLIQRRFMLGDFGWNARAIVRTDIDDHKTQALTFLRGDIYADRTGDETE
jgi:hypothetical protein